MDLAGYHEVEYLGDGAYVGHNSYDVVVFTYDGIAATNAVVLDKDMIKKLQNYSDNLERRRLGTRS